MSASPAALRALLDDLVRMARTASGGGATCTLHTGKGLLVPGGDTRQVDIVGWDGTVLLTIGLPRTVTAGEVIRVCLGGVEIT